jgi:glutamate-1-semialdehyde 2,1-aminomutase
MIAGIVTLDILKKSNVYDKINALGEKIRKGLQDIIDRNKISASLTGICSTFAIHFQKDIPKNVRDVLKNDKDVARAYYAHMLANNIIYVSSTLPHSFIAEPHTEMDIEIYLETTEAFFKTFKI